MAEKTVEMTAPNGGKVTVAADRVEQFTRFGFSEAESPKAPAKKSASSKSKK